MQPKATTFPLSGSDRRQTAARRGLRAQSSRSTPAAVAFGHHQARGDDGFALCSCQAVQASPSGNCACCAARPPHPRVRSRFRSGRAGVRVRAAARACRVDPPAAAALGRMEALFLPRAEVGCISKVPSPHRHARLQMGFLSHKQKTDSALAALVNLSNFDALSWSYQPAAADRPESHGPKSRRSVEPRE